MGKQREKDVRRVEYVAEAAQDARFALRQLARAPGFTAVAVLTLALGIGPTTAIFSAVEAVVLRRFDFAHPDRTVLVSEHSQDQDGGVSAGNYVDWQERGTGFASSRPRIGTASTWPRRTCRSASWARASPGTTSRCSARVRPRPDVRRGRGPARASGRRLAGPGAVGAALRIGSRRPGPPDPPERAPAHRAGDLARRVRSPPRRGAALGAGGLHPERKAMTMSTT